MSTRWAALGWMAILAQGVPWACSESDVTECQGAECESGRTCDGGDCDAGAPSSGWGSSACGVCVKSRCDGEVDECSLEPACAGYLTCLSACPVTDGDDADPSCEAACPEPSGSEAERATAAFRSCRADATRACADCGAGDGAADATPAPTVEASTPACVPEADAGACPVCENERCCETRSACKNDPICSAYFTCLQECTAPTLPECLEVCDVEHPGGYPGSAARIACVETECLQECNDGAVDPCLECTYTTCRQSYLDCEANEACSRLSLCVGTCEGSTQCVEACLTTYSDGRTLFSAYGTCITTRCEDLCP